MRANSSVDSIGSILSGLAKRLGLESRLFELRLQHDWREIVGDPIASHTWPDQIRFKKLHLIVRHSVWMQQLTFLKPSLLAKLNEQAGTNLLTDISLRVGEIPVSVAPSDHLTEAPAPPLQTVELPAEMRACLSAIQDPAIRQRLTEVIWTYPAQVLPRPGSDPSRSP